MFDRILMSDILYFNIGNIIQLYGAAFEFCCWSEKLETVIVINGEKLSELCFRL